MNTGRAFFGFDAQARLTETVLPPPALLPFQGAFPGSLNFTGAAAPTSGRRNMCEKWEALSLIPMKDPTHPDDYRTRWNSTSPRA
jgi:hypothetical protein